MFSLCRLPIATCRWPRSPNAILSLGEQAVTVVVTGTVVYIESNPCYGSPMPGFQRLRLELARNSDYEFYRAIMHWWTDIERRSGMYFEAWSVDEAPQHPPIVPEIYLSLEAIGHNSQRITFADLRGHDVVRMEAAICRGVGSRVYFHMKRVDVLQRRPA
ncbi:hypothetical protein L226DRAFT_573501 [Lentinus tigrinus ALCF2SS1-7]|nr:hypothetical protein L226DRAFT_573501 [Lentinus tigrinus ALCF2SS1-7]